MRLELESTIVSVPPLHTNKQAEESAPDAREALAEGIKAAQSGERGRARGELLRAVALDPRSESGWLWLASISEYPEELLVFLNNVLDLNPNNSRALEWMAATKKLLARTLVQRGADAVEENRDADAADCFTQALEYAPDDVDAWRWRARLAGTDDEKICCLEKVLQLEPENSDAHTALAEVKSSVTKKFLSDAKGLAVSGRRAEALDALTELISQTPRCTEAWILRSHLVESFEEKLRCFESVLAYDPENNAAVAGRDSLLMFVEETRAPAETEYCEPTVQEDTQPSGSFDVRQSEPSETSDFIVEAFDVFPFTEEPENALYAEYAPSPSAENCEHLFLETQPFHVAEAEPYEFPQSDAGTAPCPFCGNEIQTEAVDCYSCNAVLTLADLDRLLTNRGCDRIAVREAVQRLEGERLTRDLSEAELANLGIGHINLGNYASGYACLYDAMQKDPGNEILAEQANELLIRLEETKTAETSEECVMKTKTILVVDDSPTVRKLISGKLEKCGHTVFCTSDGVEAMELLDGIVPDLVLLDITMPRMDGYQVCKLIRSKPETKDVPVVMVSGKDGFFDKVRGRIAGATGYITKPFGPEALVKAVNLYLSGAVHEIDM